MNDVAIIGVGIHPFGRFGDKSAMEMGADAIHRRGSKSARAASVRHIDANPSAAHTLQVE